MARSVEDAVALLRSLDDETRRALLDELKKVTIKEREVVETVPPAVAIFSVAKPTR